jgi:hypothetical protein
MLAAAPSTPLASRRTGGRRQSRKPALEVLVVRHRLDVLGRGLGVCVVHWALRLDRLRRKAQGHHSPTVEPGACPRVLLDDGSFRKGGGSRLDGGSEATRPKNRDGLGSSERGEFRRDALSFSQHAVRRCGPGWA